MFRRFLPSLMLFAWSCISPALGKDSGACAVSITISVAKRSYIYQEPVQLRVLASSNVGRGNLSLSQTSPLNRIRLIDPTSRLSSQKPHAIEDEHPKVEDEYLKRALEIPAVLKNRNVPESFPGPVVFPIWVQNDFEDPPPGTYDLEYVSCWNADGSEVASVPHKKLSFRVIAADEDRIRKTIRSSSAGAKTRDTALGIPEIEKRLASEKDFNEWPSVFEALSGFRGDPRAEDILHAQLNSYSTYRKLLAFKVMWQWKAHLRVSELKSLLAEADPDIRIAALHYAQDIEDPQYRPLIEELIDSSDTVVSEEAKKTIQFLAQHPKDN